MIKLIEADRKQRSEIAELKTHINDLREALEENHYCNSSDKAINLYNAAISKTPAQSLQEHDNEVIEKCAKVCELINERHNDQYIDAVLRDCCTEICNLKGK